MGFKLPGFLKLATRSTGNWLPGVEGCNNRVLPCGNTHCSDQAMRSESIRQSSPHGSEQAYTHAHKIARECAPNCATCPLKKPEYGGIENVIDHLAGRRR